MKDKRIEARRIGPGRLYEKIFLNRILAKSIWQKNGTSEALEKKLKPDYVDMSSLLAAEHLIFTPYPSSHPIRA